MRPDNWSEMLLPASAHLALVSAAYPWVVLFGGERPLPFGLCYAVAIAALLVANLSMGLRWPRAKRFILALSGVLVAILIVWLVNGAQLGTDWWANYWLGWIGYSGADNSLQQTETVILAVLYWLSLGPAHSGWGEDDARRLLTRGLIALMLFLIGARLVGLGAESGQIAMPYAALFLGGVLLALAVARARSVRQKGQQKGIEQATMTYSWLPMVVLLLLFVGLMSIPLIPRVIGAILAAVWWLIRVLITVIALPIAYLAEWLIKIIRGMMEGRPLEQQPQLFRVGDGLQELQEKLQQQPYSTPLWLSIVFGVTAAIAVVMIVARRLMLANFGDDLAVDEEREALKPKVSLRSLLRGIGRRRARRSVPHRKMWNVRSVEDLYRWLLHYGEQMGRARQSYETPLEYQSVMVDRYPDKGSLIATVTCAFERSKYGNETISQEELEQLAASRDNQMQGVN